ncbi:hypothetical protein THRCLA_01587 [Thraustotheca clavata]|uniref:Uncharacterized protein n=1 Tax=Thraustotheca clavata TaxID=74557 RepID=A0A1W0A805_9STRA|nr:hypothetical protein THRCLA_01587 [Thraustotheca clavata]
MILPNGLTLTYFHHFIDIHGGRTAFQGLTTAQVCYQFVVPYTTDSKLSLVDHVRLNTNDVDYPCMVIYILGILTHSLLTKDEPVLWFCVFANNQHRAAEMQFAWWQSTFKQSLEAIGNVLMILHPCNNPVTLTRSWCIFEVYVSILVGASFQVAMASNQANVCFDDLLADMSLFHNMLSCINSKDAKSTVASDKASIDEVIVAEVGFVALDRMVLDRFEKWMVDSMEDRISSAGNDLEKAKYLKSLGELHGIIDHIADGVNPINEAYKIYLSELGRDNPNTLATLAIQTMYRGRLLGPNAELEQTLIDVVGKLEQILGPMHEETLNGIFMLGDFYGGVFQSPNKAVDTLGVLSNRMDEVFGPLSHQTMMVKLSCIGYQRELIGDEKYLILINDFTSQAREALGSSHPLTLTAIDLGFRAHHSKGGVDQELEVFQSSTRLFGDEHSNTLQSALSLSRAYFEEVWPFLCLKVFWNIIMSPQLPSLSKALLLVYIGVMLQHVALWHDQWYGMACDGCDMPCFGVLYMCPTCTILSKWYCIPCFSNIKDSKCTKCDRNSYIVCYQFVVPYTTDSKLSLVDHVRLNNNDVDYIKLATWYISHAWSYIFLEVSVLTHSFLPDEPVMWFCVFANNQHRAAEMQFAWWQSTFKQSLEALGNVLISSFYTMLSCINSKDAKSTVASDKESIGEVIETEVGFVALDRMVLARFENGR